MVVNKSLTVEGRQAVVPSIVVSAEHVNLSGFIVTGGSHGISISGNHATVSGYIVLNHTYGITIEGSHVCITRNHVFKNSYYGIWLKYAAAASVDGNDVYRNHEGIYMHQADNATITSNAIADNTYGIIWQGRGTPPYTTMQFLTTGSAACIIVARAKRTSSRKTHSCGTRSTRGATMEQIPGMTEARGTTGMITMAAATSSMTTTLTISSAPAASYYA